MCHIGATGRLSRRTYASGSGLGWLVERCYAREVRRVARRLDIELHLVDETAVALAGVG